MFNKKYIISNGLAFAENEEMVMLSTYARKGWILYKLGILGYKLKKDTPKDIEYSLDYRSNPDKEYFLYFKEAGWSHVCSQGNSMHIFSAPSGTKPIYTDRISEVEKYREQYNLTRKIAIPSSLCAIIFLIIIMLSKYKYIPDIYGLIFGIIMIPEVVVTVFSLLPCIAYYLRINRVDEIKNRTFTRKRKGIYKLASGTTLFMLFILFSNAFHIIIINKGIFYVLWFASLLLWIFFCFMK